jgi:hypothetical protein
MEVFSRVPKDVLHIILEFYGKIKYTKGEYINIISKRDQRYEVLSSLMFPEPVLYTMIETCTLKEHFEYKVHLNKYSLSVWNVYEPPDRTQYFFYKNHHTYNEISNFGIWYRT